MSYLFTGDSFTLTGEGDIHIRGWHAATGTKRVARGAVSTNTLVIQANAGNVRFSDCTSEGYSAVITVGVDGSATLSGNTGSISFENNTANYGGTDKVGRGAAVYLDAGADLNVSGNADVSFTGNKSRMEGGAIYASMLASNRATISFDGNTRVSFSDNVSAGSSGRGGAIYGAEISFTNNTELLFSGNQANETSSYGGVLEVQLTDFHWASLTSGVLEGENELLEAFLLEVNPGGLKVTADKAEATEGGLRLSFTLAPEPTTATLSLLALGLLAGRRRRK